MLILAKRRIRRGMLSRRRCCCSGGPTYICNGCHIPATNLTASWNDVSGGCGTGTVTMVYQGGGIWQSNCFGQSTYCPYNACDWVLTLQCGQQVIPPIAVILESASQTPACVCNAQPAGTFGGLCTAIIDSYTCGASLLITGHFDSLCGVEPGLEFTISP